MSVSKIEWTDVVWNPVAGCSKVSAGCKHCYAERMAKRCVAMGVEKYVGTVDAQGRWTGRVNFDEAALLAPLRWRKPRMVFVNSMSDLFHPEVPDEWVDRVFAVMALCPQHVFQVLTKRPERMAKYMGEYMVGARHLHEAALSIRESVLGPLMVLAATTYSAKDRRFRPLRNVWLGASVENQATADERVPKLLECPASVRFLSCEPLLGAVDVASAAGVTYWDDPVAGIHWVIVGGESGVGSGIRPMHPDWARGLRDQCVGAGVPFFFKQWGNFAVVYDRDTDPDWHGVENVKAKFPGGRWVNLEGGHGFHGDRVHWMVPVGKVKAGRLLDGRVWDEMPVAGVTE